MCWLNWFIVSKRAYMKQSIVFPNHSTPLTCYTTNNHSRMIQTLTHKYIEQHVGDNRGHVNTHTHTHKCASAYNNLTYQFICTYIHTRLYIYIYIFVSFVCIIWIIAMYTIPKKIIARYNYLVVCQDHIPCVLFHLTTWWWHDDLIPHPCTPSIENW